MYMHLVQRQATQRAHEGPRLQEQGHEQPGTLLVVGLDLRRRTQQSDRGQVPVGDGEQSHHCNGKGVVEHDGVVGAGCVHEQWHEDHRPGDG